MTNLKMGMEWTNDGTHFAFHWHTYGFGGNSIQQSKLCKKVKVEKKLKDMHI